MLPEAPRSVSENTVVPVHGRVRLRHVRERLRCFTRFDEQVGDLYHGAAVVAQRLVAGDTSLPCEENPRGLI